MDKHSIIRYGISFFVSMLFLLIVGCRCWSKSESLADLLAKLIDAPEQIVLGEVFSVTSEVLNDKDDQDCTETKTSEGTNFLARILLRIDGVPEDQWPELYRNSNIIMPTLTPDNFAEILYQQTPTQVGSYRFQAFADWDDNVEERNESNNGYGGLGKRSDSQLISFENEVSNNFFYVDFEVIPNSKGEKELPGAENIIENVKIEVRVLQSSKSSNTSNHNILTN